MSRDTFIFVKNNSQSKNKILSVWLNPKVILDHVEDLSKCNLRKLESCDILHLWEISFLRK